MSLIAEPGLSVMIHSQGVPGVVLMSELLWIVPLLASELIIAPHSDSPVI